MILIHIYTCKYEIRVTKNKTKKTLVSMKCTCRQNQESYLMMWKILLVDIVNILLKLKP